MEPRPNLYETIILTEESEIFTPLFENSNLKIESIRSWLKTPGKWYDQDQDEWVILLEGDATLEIEQNEQVLNRGDSLFIPKHTRHRVLFTSDNALWLAVFSS